MYVQGICRHYPGGYEYQCARAYSDTLGRDDDSARAQFDGRHRELNLMVGRDRADRDER